MIFRKFVVAIPLASLLLLSQCTKKSQSNNALAGIVSDVETITGKTAYLNSPYVTAGDRVYMVGHQNGQFPDLGWHVVGEMGGIWDHPIKLMDGFTASVTDNGKSVCLSKADTFVNYPFANKHIFVSGLNGLEVQRFQFAPDAKEAVVVEYTFQNKTNSAKKITFDFNGYSDLRPVWLGEKTKMVDAGDFASWDEASKAWVAKDSLNEWYVMYGSDISADAHQKDVKSCDYKPQGKGCQASLTYNLEIAPNSSYVLPITIAGSYRSKSQARETFENVQKNTAQLLKEKKERYQMLAANTNLTVPDKDLQRAFQWIKYNTDWLVRDVPEVGRGVSAGAPDYPWWFGVDSEYTLQGLITTGQKDLVYHSIDNIWKLSEKANGNGRIVHEVSTNGAVFNPGNVNETPQFATLIWTVYSWTGDKEFLKKYYPTIKKGLDWLLKENDKDGNLLPDGFGMMEIHGMNSEMIDVAVYSQKAFEDASQMAIEMGEKDMSEKYKGIANQLKTKINQDFWVGGNNSYADFIGTTSQAIHLVDDAIVRADTLKKPWAVDELRATKSKLEKMNPSQKQGFVVHHNWVVNTPMEMGIADSSKALTALKTASKFVNPFGAFVTGIDRDESAGKDEGSAAGNKKVFTYTGAVMTLPTGVLAIAENNYGRPDEALGYLKRMTKSFSYALPGSIYEVSPDYGMMSQAWNIYSFAVPIVQQFFGIKPHTFSKTIRIQPQMPSTWNDASLEKVTVGSNEIGMKYRKTDKALQLDITQSEENWKLTIAFPKGKYREWTVAGKVIKPKVDGSFETIEVEGKAIVVNLK
ncbi:glycogen debranching protein [Dyadobacter sp. CY312]|uniref:alpha-L-rhamnosidase-related protein n=1 Tax=Dyadobacter sp. CY312 TaxID=2907303 RepID=UPI001F3E3D88|nr:glycogen debranching protein [Dyadobacter sp. CY312]MCE7042654.1 glycogen debranching protein [Dyadobacter sp. CY312]